MSESTRYVRRQRRHSPLINCRMHIRGSGIVQLAEFYVMEMMKANHGRGPRRETNAAHGQRREHLRLELWIHDLIAQHAEMAHSLVLDNRV